MKRIGGVDIFRCSNPHCERAGPWPTEAAENAVVGQGGTQEGEQARRLREMIESLNLRDGSLLQKEKEPKVKRAQGDASSGESGEDRLLQRFKELLGKAPSRRGGERGRAARAEGSRRDARRSGFGEDERYRPPPRSSASVSSERSRERKHKKKKAGEERKKSKRKTINLTRCECIIK